MSYVIARPLDCENNVTVAGELLSTGTLTCTGPIVVATDDITLNGIAWPGSLGSAGQVLTLSTSSVAVWSTPDSTPGGYGYTRVTTTAATYTVTSSAEVVFVNRSAGATITLPAITVAGNKFYVVADKSGGISFDAPIRIQCAVADTIAGASFFLLNGAYNSATFVHDADHLWIPT